MRGSSRPPFLSPCTPRLRPSPSCPRSGRAVHMGSRGRRFSVSRFFHVAKCALGSSVLQRVSAPPPFSWLNSVPSCDGPCSFICLHRSPPWLLEVLLPRCLWESCGASLGNCGKRHGGSLMPARLQGGWQDPPYPLQGPPVSRTAPQTPPSCPGLWPQLRVTSGRAGLPPAGTGDLPRCSPPRGRRSWLPFR